MTERCGCSHVFGLDMSFGNSGHDEIRRGEATHSNGLTGQKMDRLVRSGDRLVCHLAFGTMQRRGSVNRCWRDAFAHMIGIEAGSMVLGSPQPASRLVSQRYGCPVVANTFSQRQRPCAGMVKRLAFVVCNFGALQYSASAVNQQRP